MGDQADAVKGSSTMLPLDPPLTRGAAPGWMNPAREVDGRELDALCAAPDDREVQAAFARHVLEGDPENAWALMVLAESAQTLVERTVLLREAVRVSARLWAPVLDGRRAAPDWNSDRGARLLLGCIVAYGVVLAEGGHSEEAKQCLRFLLRLDPDDAIGAVAAMAEAGVVAPTGSRHAATSAFPRA